MEEPKNAACLRTFSRILECWGIGAPEGAKLLGLNEMLTMGDLTSDQLERIEHTLAIYRALHTLLHGPSADEWVHKANRAAIFKGRSALEVLGEGTEGFRRVRMYLDGEAYGR